MLNLKKKNEGRTNNRERILAKERLSYTVCATREATDRAYPCQNWSREGGAPQVFGQGERVRVALGRAEKAPLEVFHEVLLTPQSFLAPRLARRYRSFSGCEAP